LCRVDYVEHPLGARYVHQGEKYKAPEGELDSMTSYAKEFTSEPILKSTNWTLSLCLSLNELGPPGGENQITTGCAAVSNIINETARSIYIFFKSELKLVCFTDLTCASYKINGGMWLKLYENLKIVGEEMNELYKFEGVYKPTF